MVGICLCYHEQSTHWMMRSFIPVTLHHLLLAGFIFLLIRLIDRHHCFKSCNIPKTESYQIHLNFTTVLYFPLNSADIERGFAEIEIVEALFKNFQAYCTKDFRMLLNLCKRLGRGAPNGFSGQATCCNRMVQNYLFY